MPANSHTTTETVLTDRITIEAGSFFETVPHGGDAYLLSHVIHD